MRTPSTLQEPTLTKSLPKGSIFNSPVIKLARKINPLIFFSYFPENSIRSSVSLSPSLSHRREAEGVLPFPSFTVMLGGIGGTFARHAGARGFAVTTTIDLHADTYSTGSNMLEHACIRAPCSSGFA